MYFRYMTWSSIRDSKGVITSVKPATHTQVHVTTVWQMAYSQDKQNLSFSFSQCTLGADSRQLVAETFSSACGHHHEQIFACQRQVDGPQLQRPELGKMERILQMLLHVSGPRKIYQTSKDEHRSTHKPTDSNCVVICVKYLLHHSAASPACSSQDHFQMLLKKRRMKRMMQMAVQHRRPSPVGTAVHSCGKSAQTASAGALWSAAPPTPAPPPQSPALPAHLNSNKHTRNTVTMIN